MNQENSTISTANFKLLTEILTYSNQLKNLPCSDFMYLVIFTIFILFIILSDKFKKLILKLLHERNARIEADEVSHPI
jgi:hypothetical protein